MTTVSSTASLGESLRYLNWIFNPWQRFEVARVYDLLATRALTEDELYLNLGYWREANTPEAACRALVCLLGREAGLNPAEIGRAHV